MKGLSARVGGVISIVGGALTLYGFALQILKENPKLLQAIFTYPPSSLPNLLAGETAALEATFLVLSIAFAASIIIGGVLLLQRRGLAGGSITLTFAVLSLLCGGGWGTGFLLAFIGGVLGLASQR
ncbi:MAG: hypothetical protein DRO46_03600 [Candidatus Hecatellales archaeon]|nr:MAG: hypothetical protein DRO46_03600 [Candidatus Hecatellales archaeon]